MAMLDPYTDPVLEVDPTLEREELAKLEQERLRAAVAVVYSTGKVPRRLGGDATREELALDKKRAHRTLHPLRQSLNAWGGRERKPTKEEQSAGAQIRWELWFEEHCTVVAGRRVYIATWSKATGQFRFGKTAVIRLTQEIEWLKYALRD